MSTKEIMYWRGKDIRTLTRDELIHALTWCAQDIKSTRERHHRDIDLLTKKRKRI